MNTAELLAEYEITADVVAADLRAAAAVLRRRGRTIGVFEERPYGRVCLTGALRIAVTGRVDPDPHHPQVWRILAAQDVLIARLNVADVIELWVWNDNFCASDQTAIDLLEQAADHVEGSDRAVAAA